MLLGRTTLSKFLIEQLRGADGPSELRRCWSTLPRR